MRSLEHYITTDTIHGEQIIAIFNLLITFVLDVVLCCIYLNHIYIILMYSYQPK